MSGDVISSSLCPSEPENETVDPAFAKDHSQGERRDSETWRWKKYHWLEWFQGSSSASIYSTIVCSRSAEETGGIWLNGYDPEPIRICKTKDEVEC